MLGTPYFLVRFQRADGPRPAETNPRSLNPSSALRTWRSLTAGASRAWISRSVNPSFTRSSRVMIASCRSLMFPLSGTNWPCRKRTVTHPLASSISGIGRPALLVSSAILRVPLPHFSMTPRRWKVRAINGFHGRDSCGANSSSGVRPKCSEPAEVTSSRSS